MWFPAIDYAAVAIVISICALMVSCFSLGWNIYRDIIAKPRFRVSLRIGRWTYSTKRIYAPDLDLAVVNFGPGLLVVRNAVIRTRPAFWSWLENDSSIELVLAENLSAELEKGQRVIIQVPNLHECILDKRPFGIGIRDACGRIRWAPKGELKKVLS